MQNMAKGEKFLYLARGLLLVAAVDILLTSFFFYNPRYDPMSLGVNPQLAQTLVYGGIVLFIAIFSWWWPTFGGVIAVLYGGYKLFGNFGNLLAGHNPFTRNLFTLVPAPAYYTLYGLFVIGGIICIIIGLRTKTTPPQDTGVSSWLRKAALVLTLGPVVMVGIYSFVLGILLMLRILPFVPGPILGGMLFLFPLLLAIIYLAWKWAAQGGALEIILGVPILVLMLASNWELSLKIPYVILCIVFITGSCLNIASGFLSRSRAGGKP